MGAGGGGVTTIGGAGWKGRSIRKDEKHWVRVPVSCGEASCLPNESLVPRHQLQHLAKTLGLLSLVSVWTVVSNTLSFQVQNERMYMSRVVSLGWVVFSYFFFGTETQTQGLIQQTQTYSLGLYQGLVDKRLKTSTENPQLHLETGDSEILCNWRQP